jgi:hypothetical protein
VGSGGIEGRIRIGESWDRRWKSPVSLAFLLSPIEQPHEAAFLVSDVWSTTGDGMRRRVTVATVLRAIGVPTFNLDCGRSSDNRVYWRFRFCSCAGRARSGSRHGDALQIVRGTNAKIGSCIVVGSDREQWIHRAAELLGWCDVMECGATRSLSPRLLQRDQGERR